jgi:hypothetical protein
VDLLAGLLFLATISAFWLLLMEPHQHRHWWLFLGTASLLALHRPITISQLLPTLLVISGWQWPSTEAFIRTARPKDWIAVLCTAAVLGVFLQPSVSYIYEYYFVSSVDVGAAKSPVDAARFALVSVQLSRWTGTAGSLPGAERRSTAIASSHSPVGTARGWRALLRCAD